MMLVQSALLVISAPSLAQWILPVADGDIVEPSPPSIQGFIAETGKDKIAINRDKREGLTKEIVTVKLTCKTEFFSAYGGLYTPDRFSEGQYVWVWYITENPANAGIPPQAAIVMLWSEDPLDKPSEGIRWGEERWHYGKQK